MTTVTVWLLISISNGAYNKGTTAVVAKFPTKEACVELEREIDKMSYFVNLKCIPAKVLVEK